MPGAARLGDKAQVASDAHGCPACPHPCVGPIVAGSPDVNINTLPAARLDDPGVHAACCGPNTFQIVKGSPTVYVNGKPLARLNDKTQHCGGSGPIIQGSSDVLIDDGAADAASTAGIKAASAVVKTATTVTSSNLTKKGAAGKDTVGTTDGTSKANQITAAQLKKAMPGLSSAKAAEYTPMVNKAMADHGIDTPKQQAAFLAQIGHESNSLNTTTENLNYSAAGLQKTFPKYYDAASAADDAHDPEAIANTVYANRMGNGDEDSGDGYTYRGRGFLQITGKSNYEAASKATGLDLVDNPDLAAQPDVGFQTAAAFWQSHNLNAKADAGDTKGITKVINGGTNGLADRETRTANANAALGVGDDDDDDDDD